MAEKGIGFIQPVAATGQAMQATEGEYKQILEITVEELKGRVLITASSGRPGTDDSIRMTQLARYTECDVAYIIQPFYTLPDAKHLSQ
jgi:4-hydroxy-tetrahydrodipicolinate synthase